MVMCPAGPGIKNDRAGDGQQQFIRPTRLMKNMVMGPAGPETTNDYAGESQQQITRRRSWEQ
jgi:hypothetical protein